jgi:prevent-host-death family protein
MQILSPIVPISDLRYETKDVLEQVAHGPVVLTQRGRATAVLVKFDIYNEMAQRLQRLEELRDEAIAIIAQANLDEMEFVGLDALDALYHEKLGDALPLTTPA